MTNSINPIQSGPNTLSTSFQNVIKQVQADSKSLADALNNGNLSDAQAAFARLQKNVPPGAGGAKDPISAKINALGTALKSGDLEAAQTAFADIRNSAPQGPGVTGRGAGGPPSGAPAGQPSASESSSTANTIYDPRDTNNDGKVSKEEEQAYALKHPDKKQNGPFAAWA